MTYRMQLYTTKFEDQVVKHQAEMWGGTEAVHRAYLKWKYAMNPYLKEDQLYITLKGSDVVGLYAMYGTCWECAPEVGSVVVPYSADLGLATAHRDTGLFQDFSDYVMTDMKERGWKQVISFSPTPSNYVVSVMSLGWKPIGASCARTRGGAMGSASATSPSADRADESPGLPLKAMLKNKLGASVRSLKKTFNITAFTALDRNVAKAGTHLQVTAKPDPDKLAGVVELVGGSGKLRQIRDSKFFRWRYENPMFRYRFVTLGNPAAPDGYIILQNTAGRRQVNVVDWEGISEAVCQELLEVVINEGQFRTMEAWTTTLPKPRTEALNISGFTGGGGSAYHGRFMMKALGEEADGASILGMDASKEDNWDLRMIYSDNA